MCVRNSMTSFDEYVTDSNHVCPKIGNRRIMMTCSGIVKPNKKGDAYVL